MADDQEGPDGHEWSKTSAGFDFVETMLHRADDKANLMWFGWALREAFVAGAEWQEKRAAASGGESPPVSIQAALAEREYTRSEMREACRNNYNAGAAVGADLVAKVVWLRADVAAMGNALADYFDNNSDYSTGASLRAIAERQEAK